MSGTLWHALGYLYDGLFALRPHRDLVQMVAERHVLPAEQTIDFACGTGQLERYASHDHNIMPVDLSATMLRRARRRCRRVPIRASVTHLPFASGQFDAGIAINLLYAVPAPMQPLAVAEMARVLKPGGRLVLVNPVTGDLMPLLKEHWHVARWGDNVRLMANIPRLAAWMGLLMSQKPDFHFLPEPELVALIEQSGLRVAAVEPCYAGIDRLVVAYKED